MEKFLASLATYKRFFIAVGVVFVLVFALSANGVLNKGAYFTDTPDYAVRGINVTDAGNSFYKFDIAFENKNIAATSDVEWSLEINGKAFQSGYGTLHGNPKALLHGAPVTEVCPAGQKTGSVKFILDPENKITESEKRNNARTVSVDCAAGKADTSKKPDPTAKKTPSLELSWPKNGSVFKKTDDVTIEWTLTNSKDFPGTIFNYQWLVTNAKGKTVYMADWHELAKFPIQSDPDGVCIVRKNEWACPRAVVPAGRLDFGDYTWYVQAGDGVTPYGWQKIGTFKVSPPTVTAAPVQIVQQAIVSADNVINLQAVAPESNATFKSTDSITLQWTGGEGNYYNGKYLNYRWKVIDAKGKTVYSVDWHETAKFPSGGSSCHSKDQQDWTCGYAKIPARTLEGGKAYNWLVEAGDGTTGFGYVNMGTFIVGGYFGDGSPIEN